LADLVNHPLWGFWGPKQFVLAFIAAKLLFSWRRLVDALAPETSPDAYLLSLPIRRTDRYATVFLIRYLNNTLFILGLSFFLRFSQSEAGSYLWLLQIALLSTGAEVGAGLLSVEVLSPLTHTLSLPLRLHGSQALRHGIVDSIGLVLRRALRRFLPEGLRAL